MLEELQAELREELFGPAGVPADGHSEVDIADPRLHIALDALAALALLAPDDPSYPWERAIGGQPAAAATILSRLDPADRAEVEPLIGEQVSRTIL